MITAILLVVAITLIVSAANRFLPFKVCPICAGVSGTWLILTAGFLFGRWSGDYKLPIAMLMGGTIVGIAFQGENKFSWAKKSIYLWKVPAIILGMPLAYWLYNAMSPITLAVEFLLLALLVYSFFIRSPGGKKHADDARVGELEEKMKNCC